MDIINIFKRIIYSILLLIPILGYPQSSLTDEVRGVYFVKKKYEPKPLPLYNNIKGLLPVPVIEDNSEWVDLYWKAWEIAFSNLQSPLESSPLVSNWIDEGLTDQIFQWDTNFMVMFGRYANHIFPFINSHDNFYASQHADGMICRVINEADGADHEWGLGPNYARTINPPLFGWAEIEYYKFTGDKNRLALILPVLEKYAEWIDNNRKDETTVHNLYWSNGQASGMDNTPRDDNRPAPDEFTDKHSAINPMGWVDMSSQMSILYDNLSYICLELGDVDKYHSYRKVANEIANRINKYMWDESTGLYYDITEGGSKTRWKTIASFWPLLAKIASPHQVEKLVENIKDTTTFWRRTPLPSLAADQPFYDINGRYWRGGVWAPTSYMVVKGLNENGNPQLSTKIAEKQMQAMYEVYKSTGTIWELYSPEMYMPATDATGIHMCRPNFVGWSGLIPISMLIENILGFEANGIKSTLKWDLHRRDRHGIENLRFGDIVTSLICERINGNVQRNIFVQSNKAYSLYINDEKYDINKGDNHIVLK